MTATGSRNGRPTPVDPASLRQEIERTRAELGETVEALAAKADVKARAHDMVDATKARAHDAVLAARLRAREGVEQVSVNAAYAVRELRTNPRQQMRLTLARLGESVRRHPAPWVVASGMLVLIGFLGYRKGQH